MRNIARLLALVGLVGLLQAQEASLPTLIVKPLDGDSGAIMGWNPALGEGLAEMLITELAKLNKFDVLESTAVNDLIKEIQMGEDGFVGQDEKVEKGGFAGADFMFVGKVTRFGGGTKGVDLGGFVPGSLGGLGVKTTKSDVQINWRLVDVATRKVLKTGSATGSQTGVGFDVGVAVNGRGGTIGFENQDFMNSALGKATVKALNTIMADVGKVSVPASGRRAQKEKAKQKQAEEVQRTTETTQAVAEAARQEPGKVLAVPAKGIVIVSVGSKQGLKAGDKLKLFELVETKDDEGKVVFVEEKDAGVVITLESVQDDRSKGAFDGDLKPKPGWVVRAQ